MEQGRSRMAQVARIGGANAGPGGGGKPREPRSTRYSLSRGFPRPTPRRGSRGPWQLAWYKTVAQPRTLAGLGVPRSRFFGHGWVESRGVPTTPVDRIQALGDQP